MLAFKVATRLSSPSLLSHKTFHFKVQSQNSGIERHIIPLSLHKIYLSCAQPLELFRRQDDLILQRPLPLSINTAAAAKKKQQRKLSTRFSSLADVASSCRKIRLPHPLESPFISIFIIYNPLVPSTSIAGTSDSPYSLHSLRRLETVFPHHCMAPDLRVSRYWVPSHCLHRFCCFGLCQVVGSEARSRFRSSLLLQVALLVLDQSCFCIAVDVGGSWGSLAKRTMLSGYQDCTVDSRRWSLWHL